MPEPTVSTRTYLMVTGALMVLLGLTVGAHYLPLGDAGVAAALSIAVVKAALILLFFMHVRYGSRLVALFAVAGFFWLLILFVLTFGDYATRG